MFNLHPTRIAELLQLVTAPAFLIAGIGTLINVLTARLSRVVDRARDEFDEEEDAAIVAMVEDAQERGSLALRATGAITDDGIIDPRDTRDVLGMALSVAANREVAGAEGYGVFRL